MSLGGRGRGNSVSAGGRTGGIVERAGDVRALGEEVGRLLGARRRPRDLHDLLVVEDVVHAVGGEDDKLVGRDDRHRAHVGLGGDVGFEEEVADRARHREDPHRAPAADERDEAPEGLDPPLLGLEVGLVVLGEHDGLPPSAQHAARVAATTSASAAATRRRRGTRGIATRTPDGRPPQRAHRD